MIATHDMARIAKITVTTLNITTKNNNNMQ